MHMSPEIGALAAALAKAQGMMRAATKDRENPFFKSAYATLASVIDAIREPLASNGLAFSQPTHVDEHGNVFVTTILLHSSGQWLSGEASAKPVKSDPQGVGSLISYLKRYGLQALVGIASDDDDDGNAATHAAPPPDQQHRDPIFTGAPDQQRRVADYLRRQQPPIAEDVWDAICGRMLNRPFNKESTDQAIADVLG